MFGGEAPHNVNDHSSQTGLSALKMIGGTLATFGCNDLGRGGHPTVALGPEVAKLLARDGYTRESIQAWFCENARVPPARLPAEMQTWLMERGDIDKSVWTEAGIPVGNTPGVLTEATADLAFALLLTVARRLPESAALVTDDRWLTWDPMLLLGRDVSGATLGIVGFGRIGREVARRAKGFGMRILAHSRRQAPAEVYQELGAEPADLDTLLAESDFVSVHVNLSAETWHLIDASAIATESSSRSSLFHFFSSMSPAALAVPTRQGVHCPQDSCSKKRMRFHAASRALSCCESTMTAAEPMKHPCGCSVSKSSGMSPIDAGRMPPEAPPGR